MSDSKTLCGKNSVVFNHIETGLLCFWPSKTSVGAGYKSHCEMSWSFYGQRFLNWTKKLSVWLIPAPSHRGCYPRSSPACPNDVKRILHTFILRRLDSSLHSMFTFVRLFLRLVISHNNLSFNRNRNTSTQFWHVGFSLLSSP